MPSILAGWHRIPVMRGMMKFSLHHNMSSAPVDTNTTARTHRVILFIIPSASKPVLKNAGLIAEVNIAS